MYKRVVLAVVFGLFLCTPIVASATTYYVDGTSGNDGNGGESLDDAWATLAKAEGTATAGDTVLINDGIYNENTSGLGYWYINADGADGNPITYEAINSQEVTVISTNTGRVLRIDASYITFDGIIFNGEGNTTAAAQNITSGEEDILFNDCRFSNASTGLLCVNCSATNSYGDSNTTRDYRLISPTETDIIFDNISFSTTSITHGIVIEETSAGVTITNLNVSNFDPVTSLIFLDGASNNLISTSTIANTGTPTNVIRIRGGTNPSDNNVISNVTITSTAADGIVVEIGDNALAAGMNADNNVIKNLTLTISNADSVHGILFGGNDGNILEESYISDSGYGIVDKGTTNSIIRNNIFNDTPGAYFPVYPKGATDSLIYNNTIRKVTGNGAAVYLADTDDGSTASTGIILKNNIIIAGDSNPAIAMEAGENTITPDYNVFYTTNSTLVNDGTDTYGTLALWQASSTSPDPNSVSGDPLFVNTSGSYTSEDDFILSATSPAIDAGVDLAVGDDYSTYPRYDHPNIENTGAAGSNSITYTDIGANELSTPTDPVIESSTHSSETTWYNSVSPVTITFESPYNDSDNAAMTDFKYLINQTLAPGAAAIEAGTALDDAITFDAGGSITADGIWYIHVTAQNEGTTTIYSTNTDTYTIKYDSTSPTISISSPGEGDSLTNLTPTFSWSGSDASSDINNYELFIDGNSETTTSSTGASPSSNLSCGNHSWYVVASDNAGNTTTSNTINFTVNCGGGAVGSLGGSGAIYAPQIPTVSSPTSPSPKTTPPITPASPVDKLTQTYSPGVTNSEVKTLQQFLNREGFTVATKGPGSPGNETDYFGNLTKMALQSFQCHHQIVCEGTPETTGYGRLGPKTKAKINELIKASTSEAQATNAQNLNNQIEELQRMVEELTQQLYELEQSESN